MRGPEYLGPNALMFMSTMGFQNADTFLKLVIELPFFSPSEHMAFLGHRTDSTQGPESRPPFLPPDASLFQAARQLLTLCRQRCNTLEEALGVPPPTSGIRNPWKRLQPVATGF